MQKTKQLLIALILLLVAFQGIQIEVHAEQFSVKDCIEHPEKCNEESLRNPQTEEPTGTDSGEQKSKRVGITFWDFLKMIFATIFVVALLYFLLKVINQKGRRFQNTQLVENLGGSALGANRSIQIVKVGDRVFIVGVGENVQLIKEIDDEDEVHELISEYNRRIEQLSSPSDIVTKVLKRTKAAKSEQTKEHSSAFASVFEKQLEQISHGRKKMFEEMKKKGSDEQ